MTLSKKRLAVATVIASVTFGTGQPAQAQLRGDRSSSASAVQSSPVLVKFRPQVGGAGGGAGAAGAPGGTGAGTPGASVAGGAAALPGAASGQASPGATSTVDGVQLSPPQITGGGGPSGAASSGTGLSGVEFGGAAGAGQVGDLPPASTGRLTPILMQGVREPIGAADISVELIGTQVVPEDQAAKLSSAVIPLPGGQERGIGYVTYRWQATNICHWPLYFEEPMLERHGHQRCGPIVQPAVSGAKFFTNVALYPYKATLWPALEGRYTLGHFRPGSPAPLLRDTLPWSRRAALVQGAAVTGVAVGLPW